jgi:hypothetical protein
VQVSEHVRGVVIDSEVREAKVGGGGFYKSALEVAATDQKPDWS